MEFVIITECRVQAKQALFMCLKTSVIIVLTIFRQVCCQHSIGFASNLKMIQ